MSWGSLKAFLLAIECIVPFRGCIPKDLMLLADNRQMPFPSSFNARYATMEHNHVFDEHKGILRNLSGLRSR